MQNFPSGDYELIDFKSEKFNNTKDYVVKINAEEQRIGGKFDCNSYSVEYQKEGNDIDFDYAISTKMYCEGEMTNENVFFGKLNDMKSFEFDGEFLTLFNEEKEMLLKLKLKKS